MRHLAVFARWPSEGRVKTRLSPALPPALAARLHRAMLEDALELARAAPVDRRWIYWADAPEADATLEPAASRRARRSGADLGERLERAFADLLASPGDRAVAIGVDCPALDASRIAAAFERLERHDVVLGPARDGGYYLIGPRASPWRRFATWRGNLRGAEALGRSGRRRRHDGGEARPRSMTSTFPPTWCAGSRMR